MKKRIRFQFEGQTYEVEVERRGDQLTVQREGERYVVDLLPEQEPSAPIEEATPVRSVEPAASAPKAVKAAPPAAGSAAGGVLHAPMTGLIKEIKVTVGSDVSKGDVVLVMEAMKMDVEVSSPATGVVAEIAVKPGDTVESQAPLLIIH